MPEDAVSNTLPLDRQAFNGGFPKVNGVAGGKWEDVFVLAGPTASGKSALAVALAERWNAEIISADAYQVYRGLAVLTAQPSAEQRARVRHHLVDALEPTAEFSAADFSRLALAALVEIRQRNKRILVVGGAGFYLEALFDGLPETPPPNEEIRQRLATMTLPELVAELERLDLTAAQIVDLQNPRRVQRAIEIVATTGKPFASFARQPDRSVRGLVLEVPREILQKRIEQRASTMLENGAIDEVRELGLRSSTCGKTIGLVEIGDLLEGKITRAECHERIVIATRQYAKRQMTWFRNRARWSLVAPEDLIPSVAKLWQK